MRALDAGVGFIGLVCSQTRGEAILEQLDLKDDEMRRVYTHVGLDIGARTAPEIALSILAAIVRGIRVDGLTASPDCSDPSPAGVTPHLLGVTPHLLGMGPEQVRRHSQSPRRHSQSSIRCAE